MAQSAAIVRMPQHGRNALIMKAADLLISTQLATAMFGCNQHKAGIHTQLEEAQTMDAKTRDVADLRALEDRFIRAFRSKDVSSIMQLCVADDSLVVFDVHPPRQINGTKAYRQDWEAFFARFAGPLEAEISDVDVSAGGDVAYVRSIHHVRGTMQGARVVDYTVRVTDCFKKIKGQWLIAHTHVSVPVDMQTGKADTESKR